MKSVLTSTCCSKKSSKGGRGGNLVLLVRFERARLEMAPSVLEFWFMLAAGWPVVTAPSGDSTLEMFRYHFFLPDTDFDT